MADEKASISKSIQSTYSKETPYNSAEYRKSIIEASEGLQKVDGLDTSNYFKSLKNDYILGRIDSNELESKVYNYWESVKLKNPNSKAPDSKNVGSKNASSKDPGSEEADKVTVRIEQLLSEKSFSLRPSTLISIHKYLFDGLTLDGHKVFAGKIRNYGIKKAEAILGGDSVIYGGRLELKEGLEYDISRELDTDYSKFTNEQMVSHISKFVSRLWQIHPFAEGNTRSIAVLAIKYLRSKGFQADNSLFRDYSAYFRGALVRANYNNREKGILETYEFINKFFDNLLFSAQNSLNYDDLYV
jgi:fido (protein-threonine AMPylation protein)